MGEFGGAEPPQLKDAPGIAKLHFTLAKYAFYAN